MDESLRRALNLIPASTWYANPSGALQFVNELGADYGGLPMEHPLRLGTDTDAAWDSHIPFLHPDDHDETRRVWSTCLRTGSPGEVSFRVRSVEGSYRWFLSRAGPIRATNGTLLGWIGINVDIEERKQAEFYLAEGQRLGHSGSWAFNATGFAYWSSELFRIHGLEPAGKAPSTAEYMALVHPEDRDAMAEEIQRVLATGASFDSTKRIVRPDGAIRYVRCVGMKTPAGHVFQGFVGTGMDVTEQEQLTSSLRKSEAELRQVVDLTPQIVGVYGSTGERLYANQVALTYSGLSLDEWCREPMKGNAHPEDVERLVSSVQRAFSEGSAFEVESRLRRRDGVYRWFVVRGNPVRDSQAEISRWYVASADIDDRKRSEERLKQQNVALREEIDKNSMFEEIVGASPRLAAVLSRVSKVASTNSTVLITGETGTGKELIARAIHRRSGRSSGPFVAVNCAAIPSGLIASELFGHEKGAFTGAIHRRLGRFELADRGTVFLDEIGELPPEVQVVLLRVLQEREIERVGGSQPIRIDVRVIAATHRDLTAEVERGRFREDLLYRLKVFPLEVPSLRERREDIPLLVKYFVDRYARKTGKSIRRVNKRALAHLQSYPWPGNVRELQNVIERSAILCDSDEFTIDESWLSTAPAVGGRARLCDSLVAHERAIVEEALRAANGRVFGAAGAAERLGIPRSTLESKIRSLKIDKGRFRRPAEIV
jgi:PAS domain S-box-containing protein